MTFPVGENKASARNRIINTNLELLPTPLQLSHYISVSSLCTHAHNCIFAHRQIFSCMTWRQEALWRVYQCLMLSLEQGRDASTQIPLGSIKQLPLNSLGTEEFPSWPCQCSTLHPRENATWYFICYIFMHTLSLLLFKFYLIANSLSS